MSGKPSRSPLASMPMSTVLVDILATATCMCCANFGNQSQSHGATKLAVGKFEAEGDIGMALSQAPAHLPWVRENRLDWVWSRDCSMSSFILSSTGVDQVFWASLFATGMASTPESSYQAVSADSTSLSLPRFKFRFFEKGSQPTAEAKKAEGAVRTSDGIPIPPNSTGRKTCLSRDSLRLTLQIDSRDARR